MVVYTGRPGTPHDPHRHPHPKGALDSRSGGAGRYWGVGMSEQVRDEQNGPRLPTMQGKCSAYVPEYLKDGKWVRIPTEIIDWRGVPYPSFPGGIICSLGLFGYAQANALAWLFAAQHDAHGEPVEIRIQEYVLDYHLSARKTEAGSPDPIMASEENGA